MRFGKVDRRPRRVVFYSAATAKGRPIGSRSTARQPRASSRFSRVSAPPCASAIWRQSTSPIPEPPGLVVKNGTNRLAVFDRPGPSSSIVTSMAGGVDAGTRLQLTVTPPPVSDAASIAQDILHRYDRVIVPEMNLGQLALLLRAKYLVDLQSYSRVRGLPISLSELAKNLEAEIDATEGVPT